MNYTVMFKSTIPLDSLVNIYGSELVRCHNIMADITSENDMYDKWNNEFEVLYPNDTSDKMDPNDRYMIFMREKLQNEVVNKMNESNVSNYLYLSVGPESNLEGTVKGTDWHIEFYLKAA